MCWVSVRQAPVTLRFRVVTGSEFCEVVEVDGSRRHRRCQRAVRQRQACDVEVDATAGSCTAALNLTPSPGMTFSQTGPSPPFYVFPMVLNYCTSRTPDLSIGALGG